METLKAITEILQEGEFLTSLDFTEAYLHVPIQKSHHQYLRFSVESRHFQFRALPFGVCSAPRVFTKVLVNLVACLRSKGVHVHPYLDNLLIRSSSREQAPGDNAVSAQPWIPDKFTQELSNSSTVSGTSVHGNRHQLQFLVLNTGQTREDQDPSPSQVIQSRYSSLLLLTKLMGVMISSVDALQWDRLHT